jgi:hypothetical protein
MKSCIILLFGLLFVGCQTTSPNPGPSPAPNPVVGVLCPAGQAVTAGLAGAWAQISNCQNVAAIQSWINNQLTVSNFCGQVATKKKLSFLQLRRLKVSSSKAKGIVGDLVCPTAISTLLAAAGGKELPEWQCTPGDSGAPLNQALTADCEQYITY